VHATRSSSDAIRPPRSARQHPATVLIVSDGAPPHALIEHACTGADDTTRFVRLSDWQPLVANDSISLPDDAVVVIATLLTCGKAVAWRGQPRFQEVMRRTILVAPLPTDAGAALVAACGLGGFVPLSEITTHLAPAVTALAARTPAARHVALSA